MTQGVPLGRAALTVQEATALTSAFKALQRGELAAAMALTRTVVAAAPGAPDAQHLLALCLRDSGDVEGAFTAFQRARAIAPGNVDILNNYASLLSRQGDADQAIEVYKAALQAAPKRADIWMNLSIAEQRGNAHHASLASARRAAALAPQDARVLRTLAAAQRSTEDLEGAEKSLRQSLALDPRSGQAWTSLAIVRRLLGDPADALVCCAKARAAGYDAIELADVESSVHLDLGQIPEALAIARALIASSPNYPAGHVLLAHILWEHGDGAEDPFAEMERAIEAQPDNAPLRMALVTLLSDAERGARAIKHLQVLRSREDNPTLAMAHAMALEMEGDLEAASELYRGAVDRPDAPQGAGAAYAANLIRLNRADEAAHYAYADAQRNPMDQQAWAALSIAWRLIGDPREQWLCDYDRYVLSGEIEPPRGYADLPAFIAVLRETLIELHVAQRAPVNQSLRGGTQTAGVLFGGKDPVIASAREALHACVRRLIATLPADIKHPFLARNTGDIRFTGSWSVRLSKSGKHVNHFHPQGWLSSAFYVELPPSVTTDSANHSGWIQFGQPPEKFGLDLAPRRYVQPQVGKLVLFPSYMLHGTVPFADNAPRMTMAFDAKPA